MPDDPAELPGNGATPGLRPIGVPREDLPAGFKPNISDFLKQRHAETAHKLAVWLLVILAGTILLHYICLMVLIFNNRTDGATAMEDVFHSWLPVLSGLAGAAVTYYFTKEN